MPHKDLSVISKGHCHQNFVEPRPYTRGCLWAWSRFIILMRLRCDRTPMRWWNSVGWHSAAFMSAICVTCSAFSRRPPGGVEKSQVFLVPTYWSACHSERWDPLFWEVELNGFGLAEQSDLLGVGFVSKFQRFWVKSLQCWIVRAGASQCLKVLSHKIF